MKPPKTRDEGPVSEITILPDGRVYVFGLTRPLVEVLAALPRQESGWREMEPPAGREHPGGVVPRAEPPP
ncbi:MAG: hypothetical protein K2X87_15350 [Gemmataceae bacterium]|nr:hypothetical protein [Gemmataceae bacterium]